MHISLYQCLCCKCTLAYKNTCIGELSFFPYISNYFKIWLLWLFFEIALCNKKKKILKRKDHKSINFTKSGFVININYTKFYKKKKSLVKNHDQYREFIFIDKQNLNFWSDEMIAIWLSKTENITASNLSQKTHLRFLQQI